VRIHITGNAGAGKTTLALELGRRLRIPVTHLDQVVWRPGWKTAPSAEREEALQHLSEPASWLIEGVSGLVREKADLVVYLDVPRHICLWRCMRRNWRFLFHSRPELPKGCPEIVIVPQLLRIIWRFPAMVGDRIRGEAARSTKYVVLGSQAQLDNWLNSFLFAHAA
jgi:adenylate kinase family enzyme